MESKLNMNILVTGTPGVGKTTFCRLLESMLSEKNLQPTEYIILSTYIIGTPFQNPHNLENKLYKSINEDFNVPEFDEDMVLDELEPKIATGGNIIEFHSSGFFPERFFQLVILLRTDNTVLYDRLAERGYPEAKIKENIECEIMEVTSEEVKESYDNSIILELKSNIPEDMEANLEKAIKFIEEHHGLITED